VKEGVGQTEAEVPEPPEREQEKDQEVDWNELWPDTYDGHSTPRTDDPDAEFYERVPVTVKSLGDHLTEQLRFAKLDEEALVIGEYLIGSLDENGYLQTTVEEVGHSRAPEKVEEVLAVIQTFEPAGVGARNLQECLWIQLVQKKLVQTLAARIVQEQFDNLLAKRFAEIARHLKCTVEDVQVAGDLIATLDPRPGQEIAAEETKYVVPDLIGARGRGLVVTRTTATCPALGSARPIRAPAQANNRDETRKYISEKLNSAVADPDHRAARRR
jgi:RNA polymerase sigma-54 factor